jgi:hypothetical protein
MPARDRGGLVTDARLLWLPDVLRDAGVDVKVDPGWETRGRTFPTSLPLLGVVGHHTASSSGSGEFPSLRAVTITGNPTTPPPLANLMLGRATGRWLVTASGVANHAGTGWWRQWPRNAINARTIGIEMENNGLGTEPWTVQMVDSAEIGIAALLAHIGKSPAEFIAHYEWTTRKVDPRGQWIGGGDWWSGQTTKRNADEFRARLRNRMEIDDMFTEEDRQRNIRIEARLEELFGVDAAGNAVDIRKKIDQTFIHVAGEDHRDLLAGRVAAIDEKLNDDAPPARVS